ncbi:MAG: hypothetical protein KAJ19_10605 [Gammaproteobacteria bacterium]|nr:hypothetical protein [Gammaproteobacteria bacterium]
MSTESTKQAVEAAVEELDQDPDAREGLNNALEQAHDDAYRDGIQDTLEQFAWLKDGVKYVGYGNEAITLEKALEERPDTIPYVIDSGAHPLWRKRSKPCVVDIILTHLEPAFAETVKQREELLAIIEGLLKKSLWQHSPNEGYFCRYCGTPKARMRIHGIPQAPYKHGDTALCSRAQTAMGKPGILLALRK